MLVYSSNRTSPRTHTLRVSVFVTLEQTLWNYFTESRKYIQTKGIDKSWNREKKKYKKIITDYANVYIGRRFLVLIYFYIRHEKYNLQLTLKIKDRFNFNVIASTVCNMIGLESNYLSFCYFIANSTISYFDTVVRCILTISNNIAWKTIRKPLP